MDVSKKRRPALAEVPGLLALFSVVASYRKSLHGTNDPAVDTIGAAIESQHMLADLVGLPGGLQDGKPQRVL
jgi:hypothetical protein